MPSLRVQSDLRILPCKSSMKPARAGNAMVDGLAVTADRESGHGTRCRVSEHSSVVQFFSVIALLRARTICSIHLAISVLYSPVSSNLPTFGNAATNAPTWLIARSCPTLTDVVKDMSLPRSGLTRIRTDVLAFNSSTYSTGSWDFSSSICRSLILKLTFCLIISSSRLLSETMVTNHLSTATGSWSS